MLLSEPTVESELLQQRSTQFGQNTSPIYKIKVFKILFWETLFWCEHFIFAVPRVSERQNGCWVWKMKTSCKWLIEWRALVVCLVMRIVSETISYATRPETEQGLRTVKAGLRGQESGASGVENSSSRLWKQSLSTKSERVVFSCFSHIQNEYDDLSINRIGETGL